MPKLGGRHLSSLERFLTISSRGARGRKDLGRFVYGPLSIPIDNPSKARDRDCFRSGSQQYIGAGAGGGPARQHIVDKHNLATGDLARR